MIELYSKCPLIPYSTTPETGQAKKETMKPKYTFEIFKARNGEQCVRVLNRNGKETFRYSETVKRKGSITRGLSHFIIAIREGDYTVTIPK